MTITDIVASPEWRIVEAEMREELARYRRDLGNLDPFDPLLTQKTTALIGKIAAVKAIARRFYVAAGLEGVDGERAID